MRVKFLLTSLLISLTQAAYASSQERMEEIQQLDTIAFGSCNDQKRAQPMWEHILKQKPQLFIWGGDNIYADTSNPEVIASKYSRQNAVAGYQRLKEKTKDINHVLRASIYAQKFQITILKKS